MDVLARDMLRWIAVFAIVAILYLALGLWLIGRFRKGRNPKEPAASEDRPSSAPPNAGDAA